MDKSTYKALHRDYRLVKRIGMYQAIQHHIMNSVLDKEPRYSYLECKKVLKDNMPATGYTTAIKSTIKSYLRGKGND